MTPENFLPGEPLARRESDTERAIRLVGHLERCMYGIFQGPSWDIDREFVGRPHARTSFTPDPVYDQDDAMTRYERVLARYGFPRENGATQPPFGNVYVQFGDHPKGYIVEGAGRIDLEHARPGSRKTYTSFSLWFDNPGAQSEFLSWLAIDGRTALGGVFDRAFNQYTDDGHLVRENFPGQESSSDPTLRPNPFNSTVRTVFLHPDAVRVGPEKTPTGLSKRFHRRRS